jgi:ketosteroid isomerase-like protein
VSADIEHRLACLETAEQTRAVVCDYADAVDRRDADALASVFATDAALSTTEQAYHGSAEIGGFFRSRFAASPEQHRHFLTNIRVIDAAPDGAECSSYFLYVTAKAGKSMIGWGRYHDSIRRVDGQWRIAAKRIVMDFRGPLDDGWAAGLAADPIPDPRSDPAPR